jgi:hypothetical protein
VFYTQFSSYYLVLVGLPPVRTAAHVAGLLAPTADVMPASERLGGWEKGEGRREQEEGRRQKVEGRRQKGGDMLCCISRPSPPPPAVNGAVRQCLLHRLLFAHFLACYIVTSSRHPVGKGNGGEGKNPTAKGREYQLGKGRRSYMVGWPTSKYRSFDYR